MKRLIKGFLRRYLGTQVIKVHYLGRRIDIDDTYVDDIVSSLKYDDFLLGDTEEFTSAKLEGIKKKFADDTYKAYGILENGTLIFSCWISLKKIGLPVIATSSICLNNDQGYLEDDFCRVEYRGRGFQKRMIRYRLSQLADLGKSEAIVTVIDGNIPSLRAYLKSGMKDLGVFYCGKLLWRPFCTLTYKKKSFFDSKI